ncbi:Flp family type IVb pilin [Aquamicrobium soli]|jgi:pilus assembly protein Flp/PilA|uniref:Flp family type IVb pilin n=1 Tax=Aquamicrobium soli TaxID=1811518 RepID=A0ABV7KF71_9HYPH
MTKLIARFYKDESGATAIEYGLIAALIAVAIMVGAGALGTNINDKFNEIADKIKDPTAGTATPPPADPAG